MPENLTHQLHSIQTSLYPPPFTFLDQRQNWERGNQPELIRNQPLMLSPFICILTGDQRRARFCSSGNKKTVFVVFVEEFAAELSWDDNSLWRSGYNNYTLEYLLNLLSAAWTVEICTTAAHSQPGRREGVQFVPYSYASSPIPRLHQRGPNSGHHHTTASTHFVRQKE